MYPMNDKGRGLAIVVGCFLLLCIMWGAAQVVADLIVNGAP